MAGKKDKRPVQHVPVRKPVRELCVGDRIVTSTNPQGLVTKSILVNKVATGQSCLNLHINGTACYDRSVDVRVSVPIDQVSVDAIDLTYVLEEEPT